MYDFNENRTFSFITKIPQTPKMAYAYINHNSQCAPLPTPPHPQFNCNVTENVTCASVHAGGQYYFMIPNSPYSTILCLKTYGILKNPFSWVNMWSIASFAIQCDPVYIWRLNCWQSPSIEQPVDSSKCTLLLSVQMHLRQLAWSWQGQSISLY